MAKRKNKGANAAIGVPSSGGREHVSTSIDEVDNGFVVNVSGEDKKGYFSKRFIASGRPDALRIASTHLAGGKPKGKKKGKNKRIASKQF